MVTLISFLIVSFLSLFPSSSALVWGPSPTARVQHLHTTFANSKRGIIAAQPGQLWRRQEPCFFGDCAESTVAAPDSTITQSTTTPSFRTSSATVTTPPLWLNQTIHMTGDDLGTYGNATFKTVCSSTDIGCYSSCAAAVSACNSDLDAWSIKGNKWFYSRIKTTVNGTATTIMTTETLTYSQTPITLSTYRTTQITTKFLSELPAYADTGYLASTTVKNKACETSSCPASLSSTVSQYFFTYPHFSGSLYWFTDVHAYALDSGSAYTTKSGYNYYETDVVNWQPAYPTPFTQCSFTRLPETECSFSKDCQKCTIHGGTVQLLYFPTTSTPTVNASTTVFYPPWQTRNGSAIPPTITSMPVLPSTVSYLNTTLTSPSVYISFNTLYAKDECGKQVGDRYPGTIIALDPSELSSVVGAWGVQYSTVDNARFPIHSVPYYRAASFNLEDLNWPVPYFVYVAQARFALMQDVFSIVFNDYNPTLVVPSAVRTVDPAWKSCELDWEGLYDPPRALSRTSVAAMPTLSRTIVTTEPAAPASTRSSLPVETSVTSLRSSQSASSRASKNGPVQTNDPNSKSNQVGHSTVVGSAEVETGAAQPVSSKSTPIEVSENAPVHTGSSPSESRTPAQTNSPVLLSSQSNVESKSATLTEDHTSDLPLATGLEIGTTSSPNEGNSGVGMPVTLSGAALESSALPPLTKSEVNLGSSDYQHSTPGLGASPDPATPQATYVSTQGAEEPTSAGDPTASSVLAVPTLGPSPATSADPDGSLTSLMHSVLDSSSNQHDDGDNTATAVSIPTADPTVTELPNIHTSAASGNTIAASTLVGSSSIPTGLSGTESGETSPQATDALPGDVLSYTPSPTTLPSGTPIFFTYRPDTALDGLTSQGPALVLGTHTLEEGVAPTVISGHLFSYGSAVVIDQTLTLSLKQSLPSLDPNAVPTGPQSVPNTPDETFELSLGSSTLTGSIVQPSTHVSWLQVVGKAGNTDYTAYVDPQANLAKVSGQTLSVGGPEITQGGLAVSVGRGGLVVKTLVTGSHAEYSSSGSSATTGTDSSHIAQFSQGTLFAQVGSSTVVFGGNAITSNGVLFSLGASGVIWRSTAARTTTAQIASLPPIETGLPSSPADLAAGTVQFGQTVLTIQSQSNNFEVDGHTLGIEGPAVTIGRVEVSAGKSGVVFDRGSSSTTIAYSMMTPIPNTANSTSTLSSTASMSISGPSSFINSANKTPSKSSVIQASTSTTSSGSSPLKSNLGILTYMGLCLVYGFVAL